MNLYISTGLAFGKRPLPTSEKRIPSSRIPVRLETLVFGSSGLSRIQQTELNNFLSETGFPDLKECSKRIHDQVKAVTLQTSQELKIPIIYAGYSGDSSVGKGLALPGSDIDGLHVLIQDDDKKDKQHFVEVFNRNMSQMRPFLVAPNPLVVDDVVLTSEFFKYAGKDDKLLTNEADMDEWDRINITFDVMKTGCDLISVPMRWKFFNWIRLKINNIVLPVGKTSSFYADRPRAKLSLRKEVCAAFPNLSFREQYVLMKIIQRDREIHSISMRFSDKNPYRNELQKFKDRNWLRPLQEEDPELLGVPWMLGRAELKLPGSNQPVSWYRDMQY